MEVKTNRPVVAASYDDQDRLLQYGEYTFTSTANGELLSKCQGNVCQLFDYDVFGNLRHVVLDNGVQIEYVIDGRNRRIAKKVNGTLVQAFVYDDQLRIVVELDGQNQVVARFIYADRMNVPEVMEKGGKTYRILHDHLGSPRFVLDTQSGEMVQEMQYDAWGNVVFDSNPGFQPFGFAGGLYDPHTKLVRFGARDYDPQLGRWMSKDPVLFGDHSRCGAGNLYLYVCGEPSNGSDPSGLYRIVGPCPRKIGRSVSDACARIHGECEQALRKYGLLDCMRNACKEGTCPEIRCTAFEPYCGAWLGPCDVVINLRVPGRPPLEDCGSLAGTVFHEFLHECGLPDPPEAPAVWREIEKACGADVPGGYAF